MSPPRRPRGEKPATTIRWQHRQILQMSTQITALRQALDDRDKVIAGYDVHLSEAQDTHQRQTNRIVDQGGRIIHLREQLQLKSERLAFLEGYYAKSQETTPKIWPISAPGASFPGHTAQAQTGGRPGDQENLSARRQGGQSSGIDQGPAGFGAGLGDPLWRQHSHQSPYPQERAVEHIEVTEDGVPRTQHRR